MNLEAIKEAITDLPRDEKSRLAAWLLQQDMDDWDGQMQRDFSPGGRGAALVKKVKEDIAAGRFKPMDAGATEH